MGRKRTSSVLRSDGVFVRAILVLFHRRPETTDTFSDSFAEFGKFLRSEHEQSNSKDYQQMCRLQESFEHKFPLILKFTKHRSLRIADSAPVLGEQHFPSPGLLAKSYRGTISSFSAGMVWIAFLSSLKCEVTISGGTRRIHWLREKSTTSLALNISRNTRSVSPVFST